MSSDKLTNYEKLVKELQSLPMTWYPALITVMVESAYQKKVFLPRGASRTIRRLEEKMGMVEMTEAKQKRAKLKEMVLVKLELLRGCCQVDSIKKKQIAQSIAEFSKTVKDY